MTKMYDALKEAVRLAKLETKRLDAVIQKLKDDTMDNDEVKVWEIALHSKFNKCGGQLVVFLGTEQEARDELKSRLDITGGTGSYKVRNRPTVQEFELYAAKYAVKKTDVLPDVLVAIADDDEDPVERERERCIDILDDADDSLADLKKKLIDAHPSAKDTIDCTVTACQMILSTAISRMRTEC